MLDTDSLPVGAKAQLSNGLIFQKFGEKLWYSSYLEKNKLGHGGGDIGHRIKPYSRGFWYTNLRSLPEDCPKHNSKLMRLIPSLKLNLENL